MNKEIFIQPLKTIKHQAFLIRKNFIPRTKNRAYPLLSSLNSYSFSRSRYEVKHGPTTIPTSSTFLVNHLLFSDPPFKELPEAPKQIFTIWFGGVMSENRKRGLKKLQDSNPQLEFHVVTEQNLENWVVKDHPLHPAFPYLSDVHKSDYIRTYLMYHHGGVYSDVKAITINWKNLLEQLNNNHSLYAIGPSESTFENVSRAPGSGQLGKDQVVNYQSTLYPAAYACKPLSPFAQEHLEEIERRLSYFENLLKHNPPEQPWGYNPEYPIVWNTLHGQIFSPLNLKYHNHITAIPGILNDFGNHR